MTLTETKLLTADDLLCLHGKGVRGDLIQGVLHETMPSGIRHSKIGMRLSSALLGFVDAAGLGTVVGPDAGVWLERDPDTVRAADVGYFSAANMHPDVDVVGYAEVVPDLVAEVRSPSDSRREVHDKARIWLRHGVRLAWVVHPDDRTIDVRRPDHAVTTLSGDAALDGADVLPGFTCSLDDVFGPR